MIVSRFNKVSTDFENEACESQRILDQEWSGSEKGIGPANKKRHVVLLPETAASPVVDMNEEYFVVEELHGNGIEMRSAAQEAHKLVKQAMLYESLVYNVPFQWLLGAVKKSGKSIFEGVKQ